MNVVIIGAGIGGLTLGLRLHQVGISCRIYEAAPEIKPLGVGINLLPHAADSECGANQPRKPARRYFARSISPYRRRAFARIDDVISRDELVALSERYQRVAGFDKDTLRER